MKRGLVLPLAVGMAAAAVAAERPAGVPEGFVEVREAVPDVVLDLRYIGRDNFLARPVAGYTAEKCWLTQPAAEALAGAAAELRGFGLRLKVFDAYRPQTAVNDFVRWVSAPGDEAAKDEYFPDVEKSRLIDEGYIADKSGHSRGSTVDLTIVDAAGRELDMGTPFDFFGPQSHTAHAELSGQQRANRLLLVAVMARHGFVNYPKEWWHFTLADEPYPQTYFDFLTGGEVGETGQLREESD